MILTDDWCYTFSTFMYNVQEHIIDIVYSQKNKHCYNSLALLLDFILFYPTGFDI